MQGSGGGAGVQPQPDYVPPSTNSICVCSVRLNAEVSICIQHSLTTSLANSHFLQMYFYELEVAAPYIALCYVMRQSSYQLHYELHIQFLVTSDVTCGQQLNFLHPLRLFQQVTVSVPPSTCTKRTTLAIRLNAEVSVCSCFVNCYSSRLN